MFKIQHPPENWDYRTLLRYERRSLLITANQPFSQWDRIFTDSMMTVAAIDRLVHHATIIEMQAESFRKQAALSRTQAS